MSYEFKTIKVLGITTDFNQCDCCGKENLKETVSILDIASGVVVHFGTTCAAKADKFDSLDAHRLAEKEIKAEINKHRTIRKDAANMVYPVLCAMYGYDAEKDYPKCDKKLVEKTINMAIEWYKLPYNQRSERFFQGALFRHTNTFGVFLGMKLFPPRHFETINK
jgi:recombinational DNA repair protein (RecF pathway)